MSEVHDPQGKSADVSEMSTVLTICHDGGASCADCPNDHHLMCKLDYKDTLIFVWPFLLLIGTIIWGSVHAFQDRNLDLVGLFIFLINYIGYMAIFFNFWESKILCSHCPFYVIDGSKTLKCYANYGFFKSAPYNPSPITKSEQVQFLIGAVLLFAIPGVYLLLITEYIFAAVACLLLIIFYFNTTTHSCRKCPNFSCVLNRVPKEWRDEYLRRNAVMRKAWEDAGYHISDREVEHDAKEN